MPGNSLQSGAGDVDQSCDDDKDVDRSPADDEDGDHYQDHARDPTQIPVFLLCKIYVCEGSRWLSVVDKYEKRKKYKEKSKVGNIIATEVGQREMEVKERKDIWR